MSEAEQLAKYILFSCEFRQDDAHFVTAADILGRVETTELIDQHASLFSSVLTQFALAASRRCVEQAAPPIEALVRLVPMLRRIASRTTLARHLEPLETVRRRLDEALASAGLARDDEMFAASWSVDDQRLVLKALFLEGLYLGESRALEQFAEVLSRMGIFAPLDGRAVAFSRSLLAGGWFAALGEDGLERLSGTLQRNALALDPVGLSYLMHALGYAWDTPDAHVILLSQKVILPLVARLYDLGLYEQATTTLQWALLTDSERDSAGGEEWPRRAAAAAAAVQAGGRITNVLVDGQRPKGPPGPKRIGFVVGDGSTSDYHAQVVLAAGALKRRKGEFDVMVFGWGRPNPTLAARLRELDIKSWWVGEAGGRPQNNLQRFHDLRKRMAADALDVAVWCEAFDISFLGIGARVAPSQILLTEYPVGPILDETLAITLSFEAGHDPHGRQRLAPWVEAFDPDVDYSFVDEARAAIAGERDLVLGSHAKSPRAWSDDFLEAIISVLRQRSGVVFAWAGAGPDLDRVRKLAGPDVARRFRPLTLPADAFARSLDIFIESPATQTDKGALKAMAAGIPVVASRQNPSLFVRTVLAHLERPVNSSPLGRKTRVALDDALAPDGGYVARALALIDDAASRRALGEALRKVHRVTFEDAAGAAEAFEGRIREVTGQFRSSVKSQASAVKDCA